MTTPNRISALVATLVCVLAGASLLACSKAKESAASMQETAKQKAAEVGAEARRASGELVEKAQQKGAEAVAAVEAKAGELQKDAEAKRVALVHDLQQRLGTIDAGIATLQQRLTTAKGGAKQELDANLAKLRGQRVELQERMQRLSASSGAAWDDVAHGARSAVDDLEQAIDKALARFK
jgi:hypothetical protein